MTNQLNRRDVLAGGICAIPLLNPYKTLHMDSIKDGPTWGKLFSLALGRNMVVYDSDHPDHMVTKRLVALMKTVMRHNGIDKPRRTTMTDLYVPEVTQDLPDTILKVNIHRVDTQVYQGLKYDYDEMGGEYAPNCVDLVIGVNNNGDLRDFHNVLLGAI